MLRGGEKNGKLCAAKIEIEFRVCPSRRNNKGKGPKGSWFVARALRPI